MLLSFLKSGKVYYLILWCVSFQMSNLYGQNTDSNEKAINGLDFGILPSFVYNTDIGLQYGALANFYFYGRGTVYPDYLFNLYLQSSRTTKNGYVNYLFFDSGHLLPKGMRLTVDLSLVKRGFQHFYGFNGYNSLYNKDFTDPTNPKFLSRHYYFYDEKATTISVDLKGNFPISPVHWDIGLANYHISTLPLRNRRPGAQRQPTLFEKYIAQGVIPSDQKNGGSTFSLKTGLVYDTRDNESIPTKGIWAEAVYINAPLFLFNKSAYSQVSFIFHQYVPVTSRLVFAYRLACQTKLSGQIPFYMLTELASTYRSQEALGGSKTIRGVLNRRLVGNGFVLGNFEFRYTPFHAVLLNRNLGIGVNVFEDMGMITNQYRVDQSLNMNAFDYHTGREKMHHAVGAGIRLIVNHNFIVAMDDGRALDKRDGTKSVYIGLDYLF
jgi:outer membrane protein assembly factor BamA